MERVSRLPSNMLLPLCRIYPTTPRRRFDTVRWMYTSDENVEIPCRLLLKFRHFPLISALSLCSSSRTSVYRSHAKAQKNSRCNLRVGHKTTLLDAASSTTSIRLARSQPLRLVTSLSLRRRAGNIRPIESTTSSIAQISDTVRVEEDACTLIG